MAQIRGGCLCGAVRYESNAEPEFVGVCHCVSCQRSTGSAFSLSLGLAQDSVTIKGDTLATYEDHRTSSGKPLYRSFCARCGSPICSQGDAYPGLTFITGGTLDNPSWLKPNAHIWCAEKQPWVTIEEGATQIPGNP